MSIPKFKTQNIGSVLKIDILPAYAFTSFSPKDKVSIKTNGITLLPNYAWINIYCTEGTMGLQTTEVPDKPGMAYKNIIVGFNPGDDIEAARGLILYQTTPIVARVYTANHKTRFVGSPSEPLNLVAIADTGILPDTRAGRALTISGDTSLPPLYLVP